MKKLLLILCVVAISSSVNAQIETPRPSPSSKLEQKVGLTDVTLEYSRPGVKGRTIFGDLVPYGKTWRTGANANTKITFSTDVIVGGQALKKGSYAIYTVPNRDSWEVMFYTDSDNVGTPRNWDDSKVAARVKANVFPMPMKVETFTMTFDDLTDTSANIGIIWENVYVPIKLEVPTDSMVTKMIDRVMNGPAANDYFVSALYYLNADKDMKQAKTWIDKAVDMTKDQPRFWYMYRQAQIHAKAGSKKSAIAAAKKSLKYAEEAKNAFYTKANKEFLAKMK